MKKKIMILLAMITITITGCSQDALKTYKSAVEKSSSISKGQILIEGKVESKYKQNTSEEELEKEFNKPKKMEFEIKSKFDANEEKVISRNHFNFDGMGIDSEYYQNKDDMFIKIPIIGKYMVLTDVVRQSKEDVNDFICIGNISKDLRQKWLNILEEENVVTGKRTLISTEEGEVKVNEFKIKLNQDQIKELTNTFIALIKDNKEFKELLVNSSGLEEAKVQKYIKNIEEELKNINIKSFEYGGFIDIDGYIIQENIKMKIIFNNKDNGGVEESNIAIQVKNWDIEKNQEFKFPKIDEKNTTKPDNIYDHIKGE